MPQDEFDAYLAEKMADEEFAALFWAAEAQARERADRECAPALRKMALQRRQVEAEGHNIPMH